MDVRFFTESCLEAVEARAAQRDCLRRVFEHKPLAHTQPGQAVAAQRMQLQKRSPWSRAELQSAVHGPLSSRLHGQAAHAAASAAC
jgi:hypothetical protein